MVEDTSSPPYGMSPALPAFHRAIRIAECLFIGAEASVVLVDGECVWRLGGGLVGTATPAPGIRGVIARGRAIWVDNLEPYPGSDPALGDFRPRFWAGAPVRLADGLTIGVLTVRGPAPRAYDKTLAARLQDLADSVADECDRARAAERAIPREGELRAARKVMSAFVASVPIESVMTDRSFRVLTATPRWLETMGVTEADAVGRALSDIAARAFEYFEAKFFRCLNGEVIKQPRVRVITHSGEHRWMDLEMTPWRDDSGEIAGVISAAHDITETVNAMRSLERTQQRLQLATEMANLHVYDIDYRRKTIVGAGKALFPIGEDEDVAQAVFSGGTDRFVDPRDRDRVTEASRRFHKENAPYDLEYRVLRGASGEDFWIAEVMHAIRGEDGATQRVIGAMQNISARKQAEQALIRAKDDAEAATRAKSAFLATMSHEIRTPMNGVLGMAQAMAAGPLDHDQRERLEVIRLSGETLLSVLNDILDLSKIEAGRLDLEAAEFDMAALASGVQAAFSVVAAQKNIAFGLKVTRAARGTYFADATRLRQLLNNLISNALKFTEAGRVDVSIGRRRGALTLTIADTGIGMSQTQQAALFTKFAQADASTTRRFGGTGLGLAICRELAELMGGRIEAKSIEGEGSIFVVTLPLPRRARSSVKSASRGPVVQTRPAPSDRIGLRLLAAEDNPVNQLVLKTLLSQIGVDVVVVDDGVDAVAAWESDEWDAILMDVQMPRMDGPTATRFIREREQAQGRRRTPIVALSANAMTHQVNEYLAVGMDGFVAKPIEVQRLVAALEAVLTACR